MPNLSSHTSILQLAIALFYGARLSPKIVNTIIRSIRLTDFDFEQSVDVIRSMYPQFPPPSREDWDSAARVIDTHNKNNIHSISITDPLYPDCLRQLQDAPPALFLRGNIEVLRELPGVSVVGTRKASENGLEISRRVSSYLASHGWVVISGLAIGIDAAAHKGALEAGGKTIAVLAHGLDKASPKQNALLADEILLRGGAWVSEYPWAVEARKEYFVQRNRIQIGLSAGSVIVESDIKSGTATQVSFCVSAKRSLFAVVPQTPNNPLRLNCAGPLSFVRDQGARPIKSREDYPSLLAELDTAKQRLVAG